MLEFKKRELELKVYGDVYKLNFPTVKQTQEYAKKLEGVSDNEATGLIINLLDTLGLPGEVTNEMEPEHLGLVIAELMPSKKK